MESFESLTISPATRAAVAAMNIDSPTPIQAQALPALLAGRDVVGQARTGSGKTLAFAIPMVERCRAGRGAAQALVLTPTRELASQIGSVVTQLGRGHRLRVVELVGGRGVFPQTSALRAGAEIVIGTPGRVMDHLKQGSLRLNALTYFVLDEADEMLDQGFGPDVERILRFIPENGAERQSAMFTATLPDWAREIAARMLKEPVEVRVDSGRPAGVAPESVEHLIYEVPDGAKPSVLRALLDEDKANADAGATLVFGRTRHGVRKLAKLLIQEGYSAAALQSDLAQNARDRVIQSFRDGEVRILVATNVAARGLDIAHLERVINFDLPENGSLFTHRVGRTGRMGRAGQAITLLAPEDQVKWRQLEKELKAAGLVKPLPRRPWTGPLPPVSSPPRSTASPASTYGAGQRTSSGGHSSPRQFGYGPPRAASERGGAPASSDVGRRRIPTAALAYRRDAGRTDGASVSGPAGSQSGVSTPSPRQRPAGAGWDSRLRATD